MIRFIDDHRSDHGVEPICKALPIAPSTFYDHLAKRADPSRLSDRARRDTDLRPEIERVFDDNLSVYGVRKVWHQMRRERFDVARCTVARLMKDIGIEGVIRGKKPRPTFPIWIAVGHSKSTRSGSPSQILTLARSGCRITGSRRCQVGDFGSQKRDLTMRRT